MISLVRIAVVLSAVLGAVSAQRPTVVRVVGPDGKPQVGARVYFMRSPLPNKSPTEAVERLEFVTDSRGRVRAEVPPGGVWSVWAASDDGKKRFASRIQVGVALGRPMRLNLEPYQVPFVRLMNLGAWRAEGEMQKVVGKLSMGFVTETKPSTLFVVPIGDEDKPVVRVPDLPHSNYFPTLVDGNGGFLDMVYFSPEFHENNPQAESVYERKYPLKRVTLSRPIIARATLTGRDDEPLVGAKVIIRSQTSSYPIYHENVRVSDEDGLVTFIVPSRPNWKPYEIELLVHAPGHEPLLYSVPKRLLTANKKPAIDVDIRVRPGRALDWKLTGLGPEDKVFLFTQARGKTSDERTQQAADRLMPVAVADGGNLALPAPAMNGKSLVGRFELYVVRGGQQICVQRSYPHTRLPQQWSLDMASLPMLNLTVTAAGERSVKGGRIAIVPRIKNGARPARVVGVRQIQGQTGPWVAGNPDELAVIEDSLDQSGACKRALLPGRYLVFVRHEKLGDVFEELEIKPGDKNIEKSLTLRPLWTVRGRVVDSTGEPVAGNRIESTPNSVVNEAGSIQFLLWRYIDAPLTRGGRFVPAARVVVHQRAQRLLDAQRRGHVSVREPARQRDEQRVPRAQAADELVRRKKGARHNFDGPR